MSRVRKYVRSVAAGYLNLATNVLYTLASVPLALHYLTKEEFGLWALVAQLAWYFMLIDAGMSNAMGRLLIDHKDQREDGTYGSILKTGLLVLNVQGIMLLLACMIAAPLLSSLFKLPPDLTGTFIRLLIYQAAVSALSLAARGVGEVLIAHARLDLYHSASIGYFLANFAATWLSFMAGAKLFSLVYGAAAGTVMTVIIQLFWVWRKGFFPRPGEWGQITWLRFRAIFSFGKDLFLITLGTHLVLTAQPMIITRTLGLEAAASWAVGTKVFTLMLQLVLNLYQSSGPILNEMWARKETLQMMKRVRDVLILCLLVAVFCGCGLALGNAAFVELWTHGRIVWHWSFDLLLAIWLCDLVVNRVLSVPVLVSKELGSLGLVYLLEGGLFVGLGLWLVPRTGLVGLILLALACSVVSGGYLLFRNHRYSHGQTSFWDRTIWVLPIGAMVALVAVCIGAAFATGELATLPRMITRLAVLATTAGAIAIVVGNRLGMFQKLGTRWARKK